MPLLWPGPDRRVAAAVRRQHPRARRLDPADGAALQGDHAVDRGELVRELDRAHRRDGADPDRWWSRSRSSILLAVDARAPHRQRMIDGTGQSCAATPTPQAAYRGRESRNPLRRRAGGARRQLLGAAGRAADAARALRLRQDHDACARSPASSSRARARSASAARRSIRRRSGVNIPAEKRGLSMVFQSYAIWPHMTVFENVAYGLRVRRESSDADRREGRARARHGADARLRGRAAPRSSPAGSSSASRWRAPSCSSPRCCCSTSRCRTSTPSCAPTCASSCASCSTGSASRRSTSRTTSRRRWRCPTASW